MVRVNGLNGVQSNPVRTVAFRVAIERIDRVAVTGSNPDGFGQERPD
jgi:hypothetical protein